eukprot:NODE_33_length_32023_cov_0.217579.p17 type:complete len:197 gc:universal NODE_33_length_32023_cov_0.217579:28828-29418(+)
MLYILLMQDFGPMKEGPLDVTIDSPSSFDNLYFQTLLKNTTVSGSGVPITKFASDQMLLTNDYSTRMVRRLSRNQPLFFKLTNAVITYMTTIGHDDLYYLNLWKFIEGASCKSSESTISYGSPNINQGLGSAATDQSKGNETVNAIDPNAIVTKPGDTVAQTTLADAMSRAFTPVTNETKITEGDLPKPGPVNMKK